MPRRDPGKGGHTRRSFIRTGCLGTAGVGLLGLSGLGASCSNGPEPKAPTPDRGSGETPADSPKARSTLGPRVVSRSDAKIFDGSGHRRERVERLVNESVCSLIGVKDPSEAFRALFDPGDVVAIKPNCLAGPGMSTSPAVVAALVKGLRSIGVQHRDIYIWERTSTELERAGFELNRHSETMPRCFGNDAGGFEKRLEFSGEVGSLWANAVAGRTTALINVPVLKDHDLAGVGCGMKNMYGAIHNPNRYHEDNCDPFVADVSAHRYVKGKLRLVLADALTAQYHGGPARVLTHQWKPGTVLASADPVALDTIAHGMIEEQRAAHGLATLAESKRPPKWLATAAKKGLGENTVAKIELDRG